MKKEEVFEMLKETTGKNEEQISSEYNKIFNDAKRVFATSSDDDLTNYTLQCLIGKSKLSFGQQIEVNGVILAVGDAFDVNKKYRDRALQLNHLNSNGQPVFKNLPKQMDFKEGQVIPSEDESITRICYGVANVDDSWKNFQLWQRNSVVPPLNKFCKFSAAKGSGDAVITLNLSNPNYKIDEKTNVDVEKLISSLLKSNITTFSNIREAKVDDTFPIYFVRAIIIRSNITAESKNVDVIEARDFNASASDDNYTLFTPKGLLDDTSEGDIAVLSVNKFVNNETGNMSLRCQGIYTLISNKPIEEPKKLEEQEKIIEEKADEKEIDDFLNTIDDKGEF